MASDYNGACEICGALYYWHEHYAPRDWKRPEDLTDARLVARLECDHIMAKHAPLYRDGESRRSEPTRALFTAPRRVSNDD